MNNIISTIQIALIIILPLIIYYRKADIPTGKMIFYLIGVYLVWYLTYAPFHELCHMAGAVVSGVKILDYQLMPRIWEGQFGAGYINSVYQNNTQEFVTVIVPYLKNLLLLVAGWYFLISKRTGSPFILGLVLTLTILSPLYDTFNNYFAYLTGAKNDFNALTISGGAFISHFTGIFITSASLFLVIIFFQKLYQKNE